MLNQTLASNLKCIFWQMSLKSKPYIFSTIGGYFAVQDYWRLKVTKVMTSRFANFCKIIKCNKADKVLDGKCCQT